MAENISGKDCKYFVYKQNVPVFVKVKSCTIEEMGNEVKDDICGDDRSEFQNIVDGYRFTIECYVDSADLIRAQQEERVNEDASITQTNKAIGFRELYHNGRRAAFQLTEVTWDPWTRTDGGRGERKMQTLKGRARYFKEVKAV